MNSHSIAHISAEFTGTATLPEIIDYHAAHNPEHHFAVFPRSDDPSAPTHVSFLEFARGAQRFARAVCPAAPVSRGEVVALVANADSILYATALAGFVRAGLTVSIRANYRPGHD
jgi:acyl-CoA synthetase (AMP-forming)/AMP-acid ligase II